MVSPVTFFRYRRSLRNCLNRSAEARGLQHGSASDVDRGSIGAPCPLSHLAVLVLKLLPCNNFGGPSRTRTCDLLVRSQPRSDADRSRPRKNRGRLSRIVVVRRCSWTRVPERLAISCKRTNIHRGAGNQVIDG